MVKKHCAGNAIVGNRYVCKGQRNIVSCCIDRPDSLQRTKCGNSTWGKEVSFFESTNGSPQSHTQQKAISCIIYSCSILETQNYRQLANQLKPCPANLSKTEPRDVNLNINPSGSDRPTAHFPEHSEPDKKLSTTTTRNKRAVTSGSSATKCSLKTRGQKQKLALLRSITLKVFPESNWDHAFRNSEHPDLNRGFSKSMHTIEKFTSLYFSSVRGSRRQQTASALLAGAVS